MNYYQLQDNWLRSLLKRYSHKFLPTGYIFAFDVLVIFFTFYFAYAVRLNFDIGQLDLSLLTIQAMVVTTIYASGFLLFRSYSGIIRHTGIVDALKLLEANGTAFLIVLMAAIFIKITNIPLSGNIPLGVPIIHVLLAYFIMLSARLFVKNIYYKANGYGKKDSKRVIIYGAGTSGMLTRNALLQDKYVSHQIVAFMDSNPGKIGKRLEGVKIYSPGAVLNKSFIKKAGVNQMIISIQGLNPDAQRKITETALDLDLEVKMVPAINTWINGQLSSEQIKKVKIEELLQREQINMETTHVSECLYGKVVLITGAAGSIGSGIVKQVLPFRPAKLILLDQAESALYDLQFDINNDPTLKPYSKIAKYVITNIKDRFRLEHIFNKYRPDIVYHAAAYKHVPLMEQNPYEAILVNVFGTKALADLSVKYEVSKFVMVSTDKAVNPTNVMGASKRIAEIYTQSLSNGKTQFITTRFGNVLDSNGSVVPLFKKQIENGGPVTITHKDITRFFMTIPEACSLILEAGTMGNGGEIFIFDMGKPMKIYDLAKKMIKLAGLEPGRDIEIKEVGLRPGEKLYEELLCKRENTLSTYHPKIMRAKVAKYKRETVEKHLDELANSIFDNNSFELVAKMKEIVPEYISNNSVFNKLDKEAIK